MTTKTVRKKKAKKKTEKVAAKVLKQAVKKKAKKRAKKACKCPQPWEKNADGVTACPACGKPKPANYKEAHKAGKVWYELKINGGAVKLDGQSIGTMSARGPCTPLQGLKLWMVACGSSFEDIDKFIAKECLEK